MPKCPECGEEIDYLKIHRKEYSDGDYSLMDGGSQIDWDESDPYLNTDTFDCPECGEELFTEESDAEAFLKGEVKAEDFETDPTEDE